LTFLVLFYAISLAAHLRLPLLDSMASDPRVQLTGGAIALLCTAFIALTFRRRRRDVIGNDIRDLRLQLAWMSAREEARNLGGDPDGPDR
jgi:hypothetical protein